MESRPSAATGTAPKTSGRRSDFIVDPDPDSPAGDETVDRVPLAFGLVAVYERDSDILAIALRRVQHNRPLSAQQKAAYKRWLDTQRRAAS
jgi:hypothetical protein